MLIKILEHYIRNVHPIIKNEDNKNLAMRVINDIKKHEEILK